MNQVKKVRVWWSISLGHWCFQTSNVDGRHLTAGRVFWDGIWSDQLWCTNENIDYDIIKQDARHAFRFDPYSKTLTVSIE